MLVSRRALYSAAGALLALGAPAGLLLLAAIQAGEASPAWLARELSARTGTYVYVAAGTLVVFTLFGFVLGREGDALHALARTDPLTGLLNRRALTDRLNAEMARAERYGTSLSILLLDLDGLKRVNDRAGHRAGDAALQVLARALREGCRSADVGARWGGDEFVVLAPETRETDALDLADRIRASVAAGSPSGATVSIGVATVEPGDGAPRGEGEGERVEVLVSNADAALYEAKKRGGNRVVAL
jgi:diguanylate cyclase (GGDEF)-like protein